MSSIPQPFEWMDRILSQRDAKLDMKGREEVMKDVASNGGDMMSLPYFNDLAESTKSKSGPSPNV